MADPDSKPIYSEGQLVFDLQAASLLAISHLIKPEKKMDADPGWDTALRGKVFSEKRWRDISNVSIGVSVATPALYLLWSTQRSTGEEQRAWGREMIFLGEAHLYNAALLEVLKRLVGRERPDGSDNKSMPSQHSSTGLLSCVYSVALAADHSSALAWGVAGQTCASGIIAPLARVGAGKHHLTDIIVGGFIGAGIATAVYYAHDHGAVEVAFPSSAPAPLMLQTGWAF